jgi:hypothetical protein
VFPGITSNINTHKFVETSLPPTASIVNVACSGKVNSKPINKLTAPETVKTMSMVGTSPIVVDKNPGSASGGNWPLSVGN